MRDRLFAVPKTILLGSCIALAVLVVTACGGGAEKSGAPAVTDGEPSAPPAATEEAGAPAVAAEEPDAPAVAAEESSVPAAADEEAGASAVATAEPSAPAVAETPAYGAPDAPEVGASEPQADAPPSEEAGIAEAEAIKTPAPPEEPVVEPRVTALHDGVPVDRKTVGFEEATVEIIDFSDFQ